MEWVQTDVRTRFPTCEFPSLAQSLSQAAADGTLVRASWKRARSVPGSRPPFTNFAEPICRSGDEDLGHTLGNRFGTICFYPRKRRPSFKKTLRQSSGPRCDQGVPIEDAALCSDATTKAALVHPAYEAEILSSQAIKVNSTPDHSSVPGSVSRRRSDCLLHEHREVEVTFEVDPNSSFTNFNGGYYYTNKSQ